MRPKSQPPLESIDAEDSLTGLSASGRKRRSSIRENMRRNSQVDDSPRLDVHDTVEDAIVKAPVDAEEPFWDRGSIVFVSWYWPFCVVTGLTLGYLIYSLFLV